MHPVITEETSGKVKVGLCVCVCGGGGGGGGEQRENGGRRPKEK